MFHVIFHEPKIPPNTGNTIRMVACTGATLHLVEPLGYELTDSHLRRAGLDYHDMARVVVHPHLDAALTAVRPGRVYAFTTRAAARFSDVRYQIGDALLFGTETTGLPDDVLVDPRVTERVRIPMVAGPRSMNLANSAALGVYEAWRQHGYQGAAT